MKRTRGRQGAYPAPVWAVSAAQVATWARERRSNLRRILATFFRRCVQRFSSVRSAVGEAPGDENGHLLFTAGEDEELVRPRGPVCGGDDVWRGSPSPRGRTRRPDRAASPCPSAHAASNAVSPSRARAAASAALVLHDGQCRRAGAGSRRLPLWPRRPPESGCACRLAFGIGHAGQPRQVLAGELVAHLQGPVHQFPQQLRRLGVVSQCAASIRPRLVKRATPTPTSRRSRETGPWPLRAAPPSLPTRRGGAKPRGRRRR